mgnify:CR=1 FL=1
MGEMERSKKIQYKNKWIAEKLDRINLTVPKGDKAIIKAHSEAQGESVNGFINRAIKETMERDHGTQTQETPDSTE